MSARPMHSAPDTREAPGISVPSVPASLGFPLTPITQLARGEVLAGAGVEEPLEIAVGP